MFDIKFRIMERDKAGPRNMVVKGPRWTISTPDRLLTSTEINASYDMLKAPIPEFSYPHNAIEIRKEFDRGRLDRFTRYNNSFVKELKILKQYSRQYNAEGRFAFFRVSRKNDARITPENNKALMHAQVELQLPTISIHEDCPMASADNLQRRLKESVKFVEEARETRYRYPFIEPIAILSIRCEDSYEFGRKLEVLRVCGLKMLCVENAKSIIRYMPNYIKLKEFVARHPEILVIGSKSEKVMGEYASGPHIFNLFGQDVIGLRMPHFYFNQGEDDYQLSRFDRVTGGVIPRAIQETRYGEVLDCNCPPCLNKSRSQFYSYARKGLLSPACKVHEVFDSRELFKETRDNIGDIKRFIPQKEYLMRGLIHLGMNFRQKKLSDFN